MPQKEFNPSSRQLSFIIHTDVYKWKSISQPTTSAYKVRYYMYNTVIVGVLVIISIIFLHIKSF